MRVTGVIQAGGKSTRMGGEPKALLELGGRRIIEQIVGVLGSVLADLLLVTNTPDLYAFLGLPMVPDVFPDHGSLGGIYSGLKAARGEAAFTVACDMPFLRAEVIKLVVSRAGEADVVIPRVGDQLETLHALYAKACLPHMEAMLQAQRFKVIGFFPQVTVLEIPEAEVARLADPHLCFMNVNTPDELARARVLLLSVRAAEILRKLEASRVNLHELKPPQKPGVYAVFLKPEHEFPTFASAKGRLIYVGRSDDPQRRDIETHFDSTGTGFSTLRRSLGAVLKEDLRLIACPRGHGRTEKDFTCYRFEQGGEERLTGWMKENLEMAAIEVEDSKVLEDKLIAAAQPLLNLQGWPNPRGQEIRRLRKICADEARRKHKRGVGGGATRSPIQSA